MKSFTPPIITDLYSMVKNPCSQSNCIQKPRITQIIADWLKMMPSS